MAQCVSGHGFDDAFNFCPICGTPAGGRSGGEAGEHTAASWSAEGVSLAQPSDSEEDVFVSRTEVVPPPPSPRAGKRRVLPFLAIGGAAVGAVLLFSFLAGSNTLTGSMTLTDLDGYGGGFACSGVGGYSDIDAGAPVVIRNQDGDVIASTSLGIGSEEQDALLGGPVCVFDFEVEDVPNADFYEVEVADRGSLTYSADEMEENGWDVAVSLGDSDF